jgi:hypothetical protein
LRSEKNAYERKEEREDPQTVHQRVVRSVHLCPLLCCQRDRHVDGRVEPVRTCNGRAQRRDVGSSVPESHRIGEIEDGVGVATSESRRQVDARETFGAREEECVGILHDPDDAQVEPVPTPGLRELRGGVEIVSVVRTHVGDA